MNRDHDNCLLQGYDQQLLHQLLWDASCHCRCLSDFGIRLSMLLLLMLRIREQRSQSIVYCKLLPISWRLAPGKTLDCKNMPQQNVVRMPPVSVFCVRACMCVCVCACVCVCFQVFQLFSIPTWHLDVRI